MLQGLVEEFPTFISEELVDKIILGYDIKIENIRRDKLVKYIMERNDWYDEKTGRFQISPKFILESLTV